MQRAWYHVIWNTHGSWLPGDPRGFRNHDHRIHSSGDYKNPPPPGEHANLLSYNQARSPAAVLIPPDLRERIGDKVIDTLVQLECPVDALSVSDQHVHLLAELPAEYAHAKRVVGKCKTYSSLAVRAELPGAVWSRGGMLKKVEDDGHRFAAKNYINHKQEPGAWVWDGARGLVERKESTALASGRSIGAGTSPDATARAVDSSAEQAIAAEVLDENTFRQSDAIEVKRVINRGKGGRAVIARRDIAAGELIERVPVLMIPRTQVFGPGDVAQRAARISWYVFEWLPTKRGYVALSLGYGSMYNHSDEPNAEYDMEPPDIMYFTAIRPIKAGEEVLISYAGAAGVMKELGFEAEKNPPQVSD